MAANVLWVSRHPAGEEEAQELRGILGDILFIKKSASEHVRLVSDILSEAKALDAKVLVVTLPVDLQERLLEMKDPSVRVLRPVYRHRDYAGSQLGWEFQGFEEILDVRTRTRRLGRWAL